MPKVQIIDSFDLYIVKSNKTIQELAEEFESLTGNAFYKNNFKIFKDKYMKLVMLFESEFKILYNKYKITKFKVKFLPSNKTLGLNFSHPSTGSSVRSMIRKKLSGYYRQNLPEYLISSSKVFFVNFTNIEYNTLTEYTYFKFLLDDINIDGNPIKSFWRNNTRKEYIYGINEEPKFGDY